MVRFLVNAAVYMAAAAIGLFLADILLDDLTVSYPVGFVTAVLIFGILQGLFSAFFEKATRDGPSILSGGVGLFSALVALLVTSLLSDSLSVSGIVGLLLSALIIWLASMVAAFLLRITIAKRVIGELRD